MLGRANLQPPEESLELAHGVGVLTQPGAVGFPGGLDFLLAIRSGETFFDRPGMSLILDGHEGFGPVARRLT